MRYRFEFMIISYIFIYFINSNFIYFHVKEIKNMSLNISKKNISQSLIILDAPQKTHKEQLTQKISNLLSQPNARLSGNSFDASHLSAFLLNSKYSQPVFSHKAISGVVSGSGGVSQSYNVSNISGQTYNEKPSSFFISPNRSQNLLDFPSNYSNLNPLVIPDFKSKGDILKTNILDMNEQQIRRDRIIKNAYKSGILNLDNPLNEQSRVYKDEHEIFKNRQKYLEISKERQTKMISKYSATNPAIEFFNRSIIKKENLNNQDKITPYWIRKAHPSQNFIEKWKDTHTRVFSVEPGRYDLNRAMFLREKDVGKKNYNLISETPNELDIRHREIMKVLG